MHQFLILIIVAAAIGLINPALQPAHLADRYQAVAVLRVASIDAQTTTAELTVERVVQGTVAVTNIHIHADQAQLQEFGALAPQATVVAWIGKKRHEDEVMYYVGGGKFHVARAASGNSGAWTLVGDADAIGKLSKSAIMFGTFNGRADRLAEMMIDHAANADYFPVSSFSHFTAETIIAAGVKNKPAYALALADLDGDGRPDLLVDGQVRLQKTDGTWAAGIPLPADTAIGPCCVADMNDDGKTDIIVGGHILSNHGGGTFVSGPVLWSMPTRQVGVSDFDGDGRPDVVAVDEQGNMHVFLNHADGFQDISAQFASMLKSCAIDDVGRFAIGDFDGDGRCDIFLSGGVILLQGEACDWSPIPLVKALGEWNSHGDSTPVAGPLWRQNATAIFWSAANGNHLIALDNGQVIDAVRYSNEMQDTIARPGPALAADLNADGTVDVYVGGEGPSSRGCLLTNRGYGSYLLEEKYAAGRIMPPAVLNEGARAIATADVDGDGDLDLLVADATGAVILLRNQACDQRAAVPVDETTGDERTRIARRLVSIRPTGKGSMGATISIVSSSVSNITGGNGAVIARRTICGGMNNSGIDPVAAVAVPPGTWMVSVRFSDGIQSDRPLDVSATSPRFTALSIAHP